MKIGKKMFDLEHNTYIMGILNVTPDSFSDGGKWNHQDVALKHVEEMIEDGADIIDIGGESTRPGYTLLPDEEEISRVVPVISAIKKEFDIPLSIDTYKSQVARAALEAGADMLNDIWGFRYDSGMAKLAAKSGMPVCVMHNRKEAVYERYLEDVLSDLRESVEIGKRAGVQDSQIILDPGIGFGKTYEQNLILMNHLERLKELGYPVLLGTSRKSMIGLTLNLPVTEREEGTLATTVWGIMKGCSIIRVHNVKMNKRAAIMVDAMRNS
ncbi:MAG: dihydropteroate synthase [Lachnospiraceae bacterium]